MDDMFRLAVESAPAAMILVDAEGRIEMVNAECVRLFGHRREALVGASVDLLVPKHRRGGHRALRTGFRADPSRRQMGVGRDLKAVKADGTEFPVEIGLNPVSFDGNLLILACVIDITARLEAERSIRDHAARLEQANQQLARFAYIASHDIQEPLRKIAVFADVLDAAMRDGDPDEVSYAADVMSESARRARRLVSDVLSLSMSLQELPTLAPVSLTSIVSEVIASHSQATIDEGAELQVDVEDIEILCDRGQTVRLIGNLVSNALKYHAPGMTPSVELTSLPNAEGVPRLIVRDRGIGFDERDAERIFEPFRRLHGRDAYVGSGIGLAICRGIADRHGWTIEAASTPGEGSSFTVTFHPTKPRPRVS